MSALLLGACVLIAGTIVLVLLSVVAIGQATPTLVESKRQAWGNKRLF